MTYDEINPVFREALGVFEGLRKLGFSSDDIWFGSAGDDGPKGNQFYCSLQAQGKELTIIVGILPESRKQIKENWMKVIEALNNPELDFISDEDLNRIWQESMVFRNQENFLNSLLKQGFKFPKSMN